MAVYERQLIACGKPKCGTCRGTRHVHGPYWYARWWDRQTGRSRKRYIGKRLPEWAKRDRVRDPYSPPPAAAGAAARKRQK